MTDGKTSISFRLLTAMLKLMAHLPFWMLYRLSDITFVLLYYIGRYRRRIVNRNLDASFPEMTPRQRRRIRRKFYLNFCDYIFETIKLLHVSDRQMRSRMTFSGVETTDACLQAGRPVVAYFSHCGNWEWAPSITLWSTLTPGKDAEFCQIYRPLRNHAMDSLMLHLRSRFGSVSLAKNMAFLDLMRYRKRGIPTITGFMSDQKPSHGDPTVVTEFLNRPTAFISGTETLARRLGMAAIYWDAEKTSRGHYRITCRLLHKEPGELPPQQLTRIYAQALQDTINRNPSIWLWTHNRWKYPVTLPV